MREKTKISRKPSWWDRGRKPLAVTELALAVGIPVGMLLAAIDAHGYLGTAPVRLYLRIALVGIPGAVFAVLLILTLYLALFSAIRPHARGDLWCSKLAISAPLLPLAAFAIWRINQDYLPSKFELESIVANAIMATIVLFGCLAAALGLLRWRRARLGNGDRLRVLSPLLLVGGVLAMYAAVSWTGDRQSRSNVIVIVIDALRADHLGVHGYQRPTSSKIDDFAEDAVVFTQAISPSTFTKTSVASLFTGLNPHRHGVYKGWEGLETDLLGPELTTLAEALRSSGMLTVAWIENAQVSGFMGFDQGFARYNHRGKGARKDARTWWGVRGVNREFLSWLSRLRRPTPFFAYIHYLDLHDPYHPPEPFDTAYGVYSDVYGHMDQGLTLTDDDIEQLKAYYDGMLTFIDSQIGSLLEALKAANAYDNTLIVITSDHGDGFMEHGFIAHSTTPYEELIRVPLIVKLPGSRYAGTRVNRQVRLIDVAPTVLDYLDVPATAVMDGVSLRILLEDGEPETRFPVHAFVEHGTTLAVRTQEWKLIEFPDGRWEFYDLLHDPQESNDLAVLEPQEADALRKVARGAAVQRARLMTESVRMDERTIESLRALGYVQ